MPTEIESNVIGILRRILDQDLSLDDFNVPRAEISEWNSLIHVEIIFSCEDFFQIEFSLEEMNNLNSIKALIESITAKLT